MNFMGGETLPKDFLFGAATSGGQVEGHHGSDWEEFEKANADTLSQKGNIDCGQGKLPEEMYKKLKIELGDPNNYRSGEACGWRQGRYKEELDLMANAGLNALRFSPERSWIEPEEGVFNEDAIKHYQEFIDECRKRKIEPILTLFHFTNPLWIADKGGWSTKEIVQNFTEYTDSLLKGLDRDLSYVISINEPEVYTLMGWIMRAWPPQGSITKAPKVRRNLIEAHKRSYDTIKAHSPGTSVSTAVNLSAFRAKSNNPIYRINNNIAQFFSNGLFLPQIVEYCDFIAVNNYMSFETGMNPVKPSSPFNEKGDNGWGIDPEGLYKLLLSLKKYDKRVMITEHGVADKEDSRRPKLLKDAFTSIERAIQSGVDVMGYLHWSLIDNTEWDKGKAMRFGLIGINFETQERTPRGSLQTYSDIIRRYTK